MTHYEYKVVPAPAKGLKGEGIKSPEARFANALEQLMNEMGGQGWEYMRADTLPSTERSGLTGSTTEWRNMLIFRRALPQADSDAATRPETPVLVPTPVATPVVAAPVTSPVTHGTAREDAPQDEAPQDDVPSTTNVVAQDSTADETADTSSDQTPDTDADTDADPDEQKTPRAGATHMLSDNGVEETSEVSGMSNSLQNLASNRSRLKGVTRSDK